MEREIEAIWPPSCRTSFVGSGPRALLKNHMNDRDSDVSRFSSWLVGGRGGLGLSWSWRAGNSALISLPSSMSALCPFWKPHTQSTLNIALMSCFSPQGGPAHPHPSPSIRATSLSFSGRSLLWPHGAGFFSPGCDLGDPALDSCSQLVGV